MYIITNCISVITLNYSQHIHELVIANCMTVFTMFERDYISKSITFFSVFSEHSSVCVYVYVPNADVRTSRTCAFWHNKHFRLLLAGISAQETLVLVVLVVGTTHWGIVIVALQRREEKGKQVSIINITHKKRREGVLRPMLLSWTLKLKLWLFTTYSHFINY